MENPGNYLLSCIANYKTNGFSTMGDFNAKHFDDVKYIMAAFADDHLVKSLKKLQAGETIKTVSGGEVSFKFGKRKRKTV